MERGRIGGGEGEKKREERKGREWGGGEKGERGSEKEGKKTLGGLGWG